MKTEYNWGKNGKGEDHLSEKHNVTRDNYFLCMLNSRQILAYLCIHRPADYCIFNKMEITLVLHIIIYRTKCRQRPIKTANCFVKYYIPIFFHLNNYKKEAFEETSVVLVIYDCNVALYLRSSLRAFRMASHPDTSQIQIPVYQRRNHSRWFWNIF